MAEQKRSPITALVIISILLIAIFGVVWWRQVYSDPQRVFQAMLNNSLRLQSVFKEVDSNSFSQEVDQTVYLQFGAEDRVMSMTRLTQLGDKPTTVVTESIGTPTTDYVRYTTINTEQTKADGSKLDFSGVLGVWGSSDKEQANKLTSGELYNESILGIIPFGVLDKSSRRELLTLMNQENIYEVDYTAVAKTSENGRPRYTYGVTVDAEAYVKLLKRFGDLNGLNHLAELDPAAYAGQERLPFTLTIDVWSRQLQRIEYGNGERVETFSGHNGRREVALPAETISVDELQGRLQELQ